MLIKDLKSRFKDNLARDSFLEPPFYSQHWPKIRLLIFLIIDIIAISASYWLAFYLRLDDPSLGAFQTTFFQTLPILLVSCIGSFFFFGMYRQVWRYANFNSAVMIGRSIGGGTVLGALVSYIAVSLAFPRSVPIIFFLICFPLLTLIRFSWRSWNLFRLELRKEQKPRCLIYGAGAAGEQLARHIASNNEFPYAAVGFLDDDKNKKNRLLHGLKILGSSSEIAKIVSRNPIEVVIVAIPSAPGTIVRRIVKSCAERGISTLIAPGIVDSLGTDVFHLKQVDEADLLRRAPKSIDHDLISRFFRSKTVLVTGAGGSIGGEISRQVSQLGLRRLILVDNSELNLFNIERELAETQPQCEIVPILASIVDRVRIERIFNQFKPEIVLHAAAYKHVPLLEKNPMCGILNNVSGTKALAEVAVASGVRHFLLISSDKAVRPTNVMGATKRVCELLVQALHKKHPVTDFSAVRFGNVLGSSGSVVPIFREQIKKGGPVRVTHKDITRYFMLTAEAVGLVLQSIAMSKGGETFVLNMGEPVKIYEMAKQLILLSGKKPGVDIEIELTGLRPGEKLFEELILEGAEETTQHRDVFISTPNEIDPAKILDDVSELLLLADNGREPQVRSKLFELIGHPEPDPIVSTGRNRPLSEPRQEI